MFYFNGTSRLIYARYKTLSNFEEVFLSISIYNSTKDDFFKTENHENVYEDNKKKRYCVFKV